jgi:hypothetical protein
MSNNYFRQSQQQPKYQQNQYRQNNYKSDNTGFNQKAKVAAIDVKNESEFPELVLLKKETTVKPLTTECNYANLFASKVDSNEEQNAETNIPDGWTQISINRKTGKKDIKMGKSVVTANMLNRNDSEIKPTTESSVGEMIVRELEHKWDTYKTEYDSIHGEGAYREAHYSEPVYPFLDEECDSRSDCSDNSGDSDYDFLDKNGK